jgi:F-type H+-transporting ATPase subunit gamma
MPSLIDLRRRIRSVRSTQQLTKAMKMVSAARLRRAQDRVLAARPYAAMFGQVFSRVAGAVARDERLDTHPLLARRGENRILLVLLTADRGLAGAFNTNLIKASQHFLEEHAGAAIELVAVGRKGRDFHRKRKAAILGELVGITQKVQHSDAVNIARQVIAHFQSAQADAVYLLYNEFKRALSQKLAVVRILPVTLPEEAERLDYIYEQPPMALLEGLLARYVEMAIYQALLESSAAEFAARMTAMDAATSNAGEMIEKLTLFMNRVRQASITREIIEVVSGAGAQG